MAKWTLHIDKAYTVAFRVHRQRWLNCVKCSLQHGVRVTYRGAIPADVLLWGEAPGESETVQFMPFVGPAGRKLDEIVARGLVGQRVLFGNAVLCTPPRVNGKIRVPTKWEKACCLDRFLEIRDLASVKYVVAVGKEARLTLGEHANIHIIHPSSILRMMDQPIGQRMETEAAVRKLKYMLRGLTKGATSGCHE
jgi:DNA polymerase